jgi:hypothetical protein
MSQPSHELDLIQRLERNRRSRLRGSSVVFSFPPLERSWRNRLRSKLRSFATFCFIIVWSRCLERARRTRLGPPRSSPVLDGWTSRAGSMAPSLDSQALLSTSSLFNGWSQNDDTEPAFAHSDRVLIAPPKLASIPEHTVLLLHWWMRHQLPALLLYLLRPRATDCPSTSGPLGL